MTATLPIVAQIVLEGMNIWSTERKMAFSKKHSKVLIKLNKAANGYYPNYNDAELGLAIEAEKAFYEAYLVEQRAHNQENRRE